MICCLTIGARSQGSTLQSKAYTQTYDKVWSQNIPGGSSQWSIVDDYTLKYTFHGVYGRDNGLDNTVSAVGIQTSCQGGYDLKYYIKTSHYTSGVSESSWTPSTDLIYTGWNWNNHTSSNEYTIEFYVSRVDGEMLVRGRMYQTSFFVYGFTQEEVAEGGTTAIPQNWLDNTTQTIGSQPTITTAVTTYNPAVVSEALVVPQKISVGMRFIGGILQQLFELKYITFLSCFVIICALVAWLLH